MHFVSAWHAVDSLYFCTVPWILRFYGYYEIPAKFWNVVLKKNGEDKLDRSCKKWRSITYRKRGKEQHTSNTTEESYLDFPYIVIEEKTQGNLGGKRKPGRRHQQLKDGLSEKGQYWKLKEITKDRSVCITRFGRCYRPVVRQTTKWCCYSPRSVEFLNSRLTRSA